MKAHFSVEEIRKKYLLPDLKLKHREFEPVILLGQARSGTTVACSMIRKYLKVNFGPESQFFIRLYYESEKFGNLEVDENFRQLIYLISKERCFDLNQFGFQLDIDRAVIEAKERNYPGAIDSIFTQFAEHNGMDRWGDNTPEYINDLPVLFKMYPNAKYVHIVRDGRDVALSCFEQYFGPNNATIAAHNWAKGVDLVRQFSEKLPQEQFLEIRYEDLLDQPAEVFHDLADFLNVEKNEDWKNTIETSLPAELKSSNFNKWKEKLSEKQKKKFEQIAYKQLDYFNYERMFSDLAEVSKYELAIAYLHHVFKQYTNRRAWKNDWYKLKLRLKALGRP